MSRSKASPPSDDGTPRSVSWVTAGSSDDSTTLTDGFPAALPPLPLLTAVAHNLSSKATMDHAKFAAV